MSSTTEDSRSAAPFREMPRDECERLLGQHTVGRVAWNAPDGPQLLPFRLERGTGTAELVMQDNDLVQKWTKAGPVPWTPSSGPYMTPSPHGLMPDGSHSPLNKRRCIPQSLAACTAYRAAELESGGPPHRPPRQVDIATQPIARPLHPAPAVVAPGNESHNCRCAFTPVT
jgi:hypothetical protein